MIKLKKLFSEEISDGDVDAQFIGWQENIPGKPKLALYNVIKKNHVLYGSTVGINTLKKNNLKFNPPEESK